MPNQYILTVSVGGDISEIVTIDSTSLEPVRIQAPAGAGTTYEFAIAETGVAPDSIVFSRKDDDLVASFDNYGGYDLVIEGYFQQEPGALVGYADDGILYRYDAFSELLTEYAPNLTCGYASTHVLTTEPFVYAEAAVAALAINPLLAAAGVGAIAAGGGGGGGGGGDTTPPTVAISASESTVAAGQSAIISFTFSEDPGTSFGATDVSVSGGQLGALSAKVDNGDGTFTYTATFTANNNSTESGVIHIASGTFSDAAGNFNADGAEANNTASITVFDNTPPTIAITSDVSALNASQTATITMVASENLGTGFLTDAFTITGGTLSAAGSRVDNGDGTYTYTATFTPNNNSTAPASIHVGDGAVRDLAGNGNIDGAEANNTTSITVDTVLPTIAITSDVAALNASQTALITFTLSEASADFDLADIAVTGGTLSAFSGSGTSYTATFTPDANSTADGIISVASNKFSDAAGNFNADGAEANNTTTITINSTLPTVAITQVVDTDANYWPTISGTSEAGNTVTITAPNAQTYTTVADSNGDYAIDLTNEPGNLTGVYQAIAHNAAGTASNTDQDIYHVDLSTAAVSHGGFVVNGQNANDFSGLSVGTAGDVNGDGLEDFLIGGLNAITLPGETTSRVRSFVVFGTTSSDPIDLSSIDGSNGFAIVDDTNRQASGYAYLDSLGDINGDGLADFVYGNAYEDGLRGAAYIVYGRTDGVSSINVTEIENNQGGFAILGADDSTFKALRGFQTVRAAGDVNGDGYADLLIGNPRALPTGNGSQGITTIFYGGASLSTITQPELWTNPAGRASFLVGNQLNDNMGWSLDGGDINGDGYSDIIASTFLSSDGNSFNGATWVYFGASNLADVQSRNDIADASKALGYGIFGTTSFQYVGNMVSVGGDVNGDGLADILIGAWTSDSSGSAYIVFGKTDYNSQYLSDIGAGTAGFVMHGLSANSELGFSVDTIGDMNGDGLADIIIGARSTDSNGFTKGGEAYVVWGKTDQGEIFRSDLANENGGFILHAEQSEQVAGYFVSYAGDVNGDGLSDLLVSAPSTDVNGVVDAGRTYVIFGTSTGALYESHVDQMGTVGNDTLTSSGTQTLIGNSGDDTLISNGADVLYGGMGNDRFELDATTTTALEAVFGQGGNINQLASIHGGTGLDTIALLGTASLDLTQITNSSASNANVPGRIDSIEAIDLGQDGNANSLTLNVFDVLDMAAANTFSNAGWAGLLTSVNHQLLIDGNSNDTVHLKDLGDWTLTGSPVSHDGQSYTVWIHNSVAAQLIIDADVTVVL